MSDFFYEANIPFNVAHHMAFINVVSKMSYRLLSYLYFEHNY